MIGGLFTRQLFVGKDESAVACLRLDQNKVLSPPPSSTCSSPFIDRELEVNNHPPGNLGATHTLIMDRRGNSPDLMGLGTKLLRRACHETTAEDTHWADSWRGDPHRVYFRFEERPFPDGHNSTLHVLYSNTPLAFCADASPSSPRPYALFCLLLLAALQPTGRILGRKASTPWIIRCFPILYVADALAVLVSWMHLALVSGNGIRHAASAVFEARNSGEMEHWTFSLTKAKAAAPARWAACVFGVGLSPLLDALHSDASGQVKVFLSVYAVAWLGFEALLLAATIDSDEDKTNSAKPAAPETADTTSGSDSPALESPPPHNAASVGEQEEKPAQLRVPVEPKSESEPKTTPITPKDNDPSTSSATRDSSQILRYFSTTAILVSAVYHIAPFVSSEAAEWYGYLAGWYLAEPVDPPGSSLFKLAESSLSAIFWIMIVTQDLQVGGWLPTTGDGDQAQDLHVKWPVGSGLIWGYMEVLYRLLGERSEPEGGGGLWIAAAIGGFVAVRWLGGGRGGIGVGKVDWFRLSVVFSAVMFYTREDTVPIIWVLCLMGGLCRRLRL